MKRISICLFCLILNSCSYQPSYSEIKPGFSLIIKKSLTIPADSARIILQQGRLTTLARIDRYQPHCFFISNKVGRQEQIIGPDHFIITKVIQSFEMVKMRTGGYFLSALLFNDGLTAVDYATELTISSQKQPDIIKLTCRHWEDPDDPEHLNLQQIQGALGDFAYIQIN